MSRLQIQIFNVFEEAGKRIDLNFRQFYQKRFKELSKDNGLYTLADKFGIIISEARRKFGLDSCPVKQELEEYFKSLEN